MRLLVFALAAIGLMSACSSGGSRFVRPVSTPVQGANDLEASDYQDGYLRIFVSSNLDETGRLLDFGKEGQRPAMLLISARFGKGTVASFSADSEPEIPVLLYDVQAGKTQSSIVDNALLSSGLLIDPESLSTSPHLQIYVRGVPADKARWVTDLLELATAEPVLKVGLSFVPGGATFSPLSTKLGDMLSEEIKTSEKPWEEKTLLGLRPDEGLASLHGRQFIVLLNSTTIELEPPPTLERCDTRRSLTGLCYATGGAWEPAQAYVRFELDVTDYRSIKDFIASDVGCESDERIWSDFRALLASGQLARKQAEYERLILTRGELLTDARRAQADRSAAPYTGRMLRLAQRFVLLRTPDDAYWADHYAKRAAALDDCVRNVAIGGTAQNAAIWDEATQIYSRLPTYELWAESLASNSDPEAQSLKAAEAELLSIDRLLARPELRSLSRENLASLNGPRIQLERMLTATYDRIIRRVVATSEPAFGKAERLEVWAEATRCSVCRDRLLAEADALIKTPESSDGHQDSDSAPPQPGDAR